MTRPPKANSREMTRRATNAAHETRQSVARAIGRNTADATPYDDPDRPVGEAEVDPARVEHSRQLDRNLEEQRAAADKAEKHPDAQLNPTDDDNEPDTIARGRQAAPPQTRRDAGQSRTGEG